MLFEHNPEGWCPLTGKPCIQKCCRMNCNYSFMKSIGSKINVTAGNSFYCRCILLECGLIGSGQGLLQRKFYPVNYQNITKYSKKEDKHGDTDNLAAAIADKYRIFRDEDSTLILDVDEERRLDTQGVTNVQTRNIEDEFSGINLKRGVHGVYDIEDLIALLRRDKAQDIFVAKLPSELKYVDYIVVVSGKSARHMLAMAEFVRKVFKRKRHQNDLLPKIEGENCKDWIALDLGNIALHIFSKSVRHIYDLESLWAVGAEYDDLCNTPEDPLITLLQKHSIYLGDLQPSETNG